MDINTYSGPMSGVGNEKPAMANLEGGGTNGKRDGDKKNRVWIFSEEQGLMQVLKMAKAGGLKSENGWKTNYKNFLWNELNKILPGTDIQVQPHIMSKLKQWNREYACISSIKDKNGSGWDAVEKRVLCSQEMWNAHVQAHPVMLKKKHCCWPFYDDWEYVFGKDRANGKGATDVREDAKRFIPDIINKANKKTMGLEDFGCNDDQWYDGDDGASSANTAKKAKSTSTTSMTTADEGFISAISQILNKDKGQEESTNVLRSKVNEALKQLGLSDKDRLMIGRRMAKDESLLHYFFSLNEDDRKACVLQELDDISTYHLTF